jgi:hypothetical protein
MHERMHEPMNHPRRPPITDRRPKMLLRNTTALALSLLSAPLMAHTGHGGMPGHLHTWGVEYAALLVIAGGALAMWRLARRRK